jgi:transcriptional regulator with XRE-family HTH domain
MDVIKRRMKPSEPLIRLLRETAQTKGMNTAALADAVGLSRNELKQVLAGTLALTVDLLVELAEVLELGPTDLAALGLELPTESIEPLKQVTPNAVRIVDESVQAPDPYGNHTEQILKLGFALGCDMHIVLQPSALKESGIPDASLEQFPDLFPLKLDAAFHHHNDPHFLPTGMRLVLSFDALYTCVLPWSAFVQVTMTPLTFTQQEPEPSPTESRTHLRLIE